MNVLKQEKVRALRDSFIASGKLPVLARYWAQKAVDECEISLLNDRDKLKSGDE